MLDELISKHRRAPTDGAVLLELSNLFIERGLHGDNVQLLESFRCQNSYIERLLRNLAISYTKLFRPWDAERVLASVVSSGTVSLETLTAWADLKQHLDKPQEVVQFLSPVIESNPECASLLYFYSKALAQISPSKAVSPAIAACRLEPTNKRYLGLVFDCYLMTGDECGALEFMSWALEHNKHEPMLHLLRVEERIFSSSEIDSDAVEAMKQIEHDFDLETKMQFYALLSRYYEKEDDYKNAAKFFHRASSLIDSKVASEPVVEQVESTVEYMKRCYPEYASKQNSAGYRGDKKHVFVVGMPRSGSTLLEKVVTAHSKVDSVGEKNFLTNVSNGYRARTATATEAHFIDYSSYPKWPIEMPKSAFERGRHYSTQVASLCESDVIIDKMPANLFYIGFVNDFIPDSKVIYTRRHPVAACLSAYRLFFEEGHLWTYNLRTLGRYYRASLSMMQYWKALYPNMIAEVKYEDLVLSFESESRRLIEFLDLEWEQGVIDFSSRVGTVRTASSMQVRRPVYKTSLFQWEKYKPFLSELYDEIGDLIEEYEDELGY